MDQVNEYIRDHEFSHIIHCAALARMTQCEKEPDVACHTNIIGTSHLVNAVLKKEKESQTPIRFVYISTDGVYDGVDGNFHERGPTLPYNKYGWSKLGGECAVQMYKNSLILRVSMTEKPFVHKSAFVNMISNFIF